MDIKKGVQEVVNSIYAESGEVRPSALVEAARPDQSPAHNAFEWDDSKAGQEYRLMQARQWIRMVEIIVNDQPERLIHIPAITKDENGNPNDREGFYKPASVVVQNTDEFELALDRVRRQVESASESYRYLKMMAEKAKPKGKRKKARRVDFRRADRGFAQVQAALG